MRPDPGNVELRCPEVPQEECGIGYLEVPIRSSGLKSGLSSSFPVPTPALWLFSPFLEAE